MKAKIFSQGGRVMRALPRTSTVLLLAVQITSAQTAFKDFNDYILYIPIPSDVSKNAVLHADEPLKQRLHALVSARLSTETIIGGQERKDLIVILLDQEGEPILPDLASAKSQSAEPTASELTFTFDSPAYPWTLDEIKNLRAALGDFYPTAKSVYGSPAFNITVNVRKGPLTSFSGEYNPSLNEIVLDDRSDLAVLCHEMIHAFRDDDIIGLSSYEEGMTRAAEVEVFDRLTAYTHPFDENHSYEYDVYYEGLDKSTIGSQGGNFFLGYVSALLRYQLTGYAWAKPLLENSNFLVDFNRNLYAKILSDPTVRHTESKLVAIAKRVQPVVEGKRFVTWYGQQGVLNSDPPKGYFLYQRINQFLIDYFLRDPSGIETMQPNATIDWAVYDNKNTLLGSGTGVTSAFGFFDLSTTLTLPIGYSGRIKVLATTLTPLGMISNTALRFVGKETGVFGVVADADVGTITIKSLDLPTPPARASVVNGGFFAPSLAQMSGRFLAVFVARNGGSITKRFTKGASNYFLVLEGVNR